MTSSSNITTLLFVLVFHGIAHAQLHITQIKYGTWGYKTIVTAGKEQHYTAPNECGFWDGLTINNSAMLHEFTYGGIQFRGYQIGISGEKICVTSPITFQLEASRNACYTTWIRLIDQPNRLIRLSEGYVVEYEIKRLSRRSMRLLKVRDMDNDAVGTPDRIELEWVKR